MSRSDHLKPDSAHLLMLAQECEDSARFDRPIDPRKLLAEVAPVLRACAQEGQELEAMRARKDAAYEERNRVVAALARLFPSGLARTNIPGWSDDWHGCVYIDLPTGQVSWHYHDSQSALFAGLPPYTGSWDGHDTPEKYRRLAALFASPQKETHCDKCGKPFKPEDDVFLMGSRGNYHQACMPMASPQQGQWQPIETAPKDGSEFLGINCRAAAVGYRVVYFDDEAKEPYIWHVEDAAKGFNHHRDFLTHWMPLPPRPRLQEEGDDR